MPTTHYAIIAVVAYLLGSIPFGYILVRLFTGSDVRAQGSGNIGATNVARTGNKGLAIATLALDAAKGAAAVLFAYQYFLHRWNSGPLYDGMEPRQLAFQLATLAALFAVVGHMYPVWLRFKGGKGVAMALGVYLALSPKAILVAVVVFLIVVAVTRYVSLGSVVASAVFPVGFWYLHGRNSTLAVMVMICAIQALIIWKHSDNIRRLMAGTESRFGAKKAGVQ